MKLSFLLRNTFPHSWSYPEPVLLALASLLSVVRSSMEAARTKNFSATQFRRSYRHFKLNMFDMLTPRWSSVHPESEVTSWFSSQGFTARRLGPGEYVGVKSPALQARDGASGRPRREESIP